MGTESDRVGRYIYSVDFGPSNMRRLYKNFYIPVAKKKTKYMNRHDIKKLSK